MSAHIPTADTENRTPTDAGSPRKGELQRLVEEHPLFQHRAAVGGVEFADLSTAQRDESNGALYITDIGNHVRLYLGGDTPLLVYTEEQVEEEETAMEGERDAAPNTKSLVGAHEFYQRKHQINTSRLAQDIELADGRTLLVSMRFIPEDER